MPGSGVLGQNKIFGTLPEAHHMLCRRVTALSGPSGSTAHDDVVPTVAIKKLGMRPACDAAGDELDTEQHRKRCNHITTQRTWLRRGTAQQ